MKKRLRRGVFLAGLVLLLVLCGNCLIETLYHPVSVNSDPDTDLPADTALAPPSPIPIPTPAPTPVPTPFPEYDISLMMVGDNLMHMGIVYSGKQQDGSYNYDALYECISEQLQAADIKIINQETVLGGNDLGFSGYPYFNSPTEVGDAIAAAGFNVVLHASNHAADQKLRGLEHCTTFWEEQHPEVMMLGIRGDLTAEGRQYGTARSGSANAGEVSADDWRTGETGVADWQTGETGTDNWQTDETGAANWQTGSGAASWQTDAAGIGYMTVRGITFAILNYTYGPNMEVIPSSIRGHLNLLCDCDPQNGQLDFTSLNPQVLEDIATARARADMVIVCPHWGTEYATAPSSYQEKFARQMTEAGADLIIGTHPHVVQPVEWIEADNGNRSLCFYSLGNYVSTQKEGICMLEAMAWVTFHVDESGVAIAEQYSGALPLVCQYTGGPVRFDGIYLLQDYTQEQAARHGIRSYGGVNLSLDDLLKWSSEILGDSVLHWPENREENPSLTDR